MTKTLGLALGTLMLLAASAESQAQQKTFLTLRAGGTAGAIFASSAVLTTIINRVIPEYRITPTPSGGTQSPMDVSGGKAQYGYTYAQSALDAYNGVPPFKQKYDNLRAVITLYDTSGFHIVTTQRSSIQKFEDLKGKRLSPTQPNFSSWQVMDAALALAGIKKSEITLVPLNIADQNASLADGQVDAISTLTGLPNADYKEMEATTPLRFIAMPEATINSFVEKYPGYVRGEIPAKTYASNPQSLATIFAPVILITSADRPEEEVYRIVKALVDNQEEFRKSYTAVNFQKDKFMAGLKIPLHPGAEKYLKEIGVATGVAGAK